MQLNTVHRCRPATVINAWNKKKQHVKKFRTPHIKNSDTESNASELYKMTLEADFFEMLWSKRRQIDPFPAKWGQVFQAF